MFTRARPAADRAPKSRISAADGSLRAHTRALALQFPACLHSFHRNNLSGNAMQ